MPLSKCYSIVLQGFPTLGTRAGGVKSAGFARPRGSFVPPSKGRSAAANNKGPECAKGRIGASLRDREGRLSEILRKEERVSPGHKGREEWPGGDHAECCGIDFGREPHCAGWCGAIGEPAHWGDIRRIGNLFGSVLYIQLFMHTDEVQAVLFIRS